MVSLWLTRALVQFEQLPLLTTQHLFNFQSKFVLAFLVLQSLVVGHDVVDDGFFVFFVGDCSGVVNEFFILAWCLGRPPIANVRGCFGRFVQVQQFVDGQDGVVGHRHQPCVRQRNGIHGVWQRAKKSGEKSTREVVKKSHGEW